MALQWKPVPNHDGYEVNEDGQVRNSRTGHILRPGPSNYGHLSVVLGRGNTRMVHALVLEAFVSPRPKGMECRHLDGDPKNNRLENLRWGTRSENIQDAIRHGTWKDARAAAGAKNKADPRRKEIALKAARARWAKELGL